MYERQSHDWTGSQCRISLLSARSYIFTFQRRCTTGGGAAAARRRPVLYGCRARAGYRSANMARCAQLLQGAVFTWVRVLPVRVRRRRLLSRYANIRISLNEHAISYLSVACDNTKKKNLLDSTIFIHRTFSLVSYQSTKINSFLLSKSRSGSKSFCIVRLDNINFN